MRYPVAERFKAPQGEGLYTGTQMAFIRLMGCSVGTDVCTHCDTDFNVMASALGGGLYEDAELAAWADPCAHVCLTGGEPLDRDIRPLLAECQKLARVCHVETSGTRHSDWLDTVTQQTRNRELHAVATPTSRGTVSWAWTRLWVTVSPKPGYRPEMVEQVADEVKVIIGGLGDGPGWPDVDDAVRWADKGILVYVQPRNERLEVDHVAMDEALEVVAKHPQLRLSTQLHKYLRTR